MHVVGRVRTVAAIPAVGLLAGSAAGFLLSETVHAVAVALLICGAVVSVWAWRFQHPWLIGSAAAAAFAGGGAILAADAWQKAWRPTLRIAFEDLARAERARAAAERRLMPEDDEAFATVEGVLRSDASLTAAGVSLSLTVDQILSGGFPAEVAQGFSPAKVVQDVSPAADPAVGVSGGILATVVGSLGPRHVNDWRAGRRVRMPVRLRRPTRYLNPGVPDNERMLARAGTTLVGTVKSGALVELVAYGNRWSETAASVRLFARRAIASAVGRWKPQSAAIVTAIVIGDRAGLDDDVQRRLQEAGTYHVIAISGGNIAILAGILIGAFRIAGCLGRGAMFAAIGVLLAYAGLVGGGASVERATLMAVAYLAARAFDQRSAPLNVLWMVAAALVAADPLSVADPGFVLTFGATLGILLSQPLERTEHFSMSSAGSGRRPGPGTPRLSSGALFLVFRAMCVASIAAEAMLFPVGALLFSRITFAGLALNFLAIPLMSVAQLAGMAVVAMALVSERLAAAIGWVAHIGASGLVWSADLVRFAPVLTYRVAPPAWSVVFVYYMSFGIAWALWQRAGRSWGADSSRSRRVATAVAASAALWILIQPSALLAARGDGRLHITFIDVGQGDGALLRFPGGTTMVVDAGGLAGSSGFDIGDRVVAPVLRDAGIRRLDFAVLTHGDPDHVGGMPALVREFRPRDVWEGIPVPRFDPLAALRAQAQGVAARWANVYRGGRLLVDGVEIVVGHPALPDWERQKVRNDDSIVLDVRWRDVSVLLTGDIGREVETVLADAIPPAPLRVVKVPHHGSLTSSSAGFLRAVRPQVAVFSAGRANHFGHPAPAVLQRYRDIGAEIFRTDQDGAILLHTDGYSFDIQSFTGRTLRLPRKHESTK